MNSPARILLLISCLLRSVAGRTAGVRKTHRARAEFVGQVREAALTYWRTESGTKIARMNPIQSTVYATGFCRDQTWGTGAVPVFPKASRTACATEETGFHSAITLSGPGSTVPRTNVFAM